MYNFLSGNMMNNIMKQLIKVNQYAIKLHKCSIYMMCYLNSTKSVFISDHQRIYQLCKDDNAYFKAMKDRVPQPKQGLLTFYQLSTENNTAFKYSVSHRMYGKPNKPIFHCIVTLDGPMKESVEGFAEKKTTSENIASLKALKLLFEGNFCNLNGRPKISTTEDAISRTLLQSSLIRPIPLNLPQEVLSLAENIVNKYNHEIKELLPREDVTREERPLLDTSFADEPPICLMTGKPLNCPLNADPNIDQYLLNKLKEDDKSILRGIIKELAINKLREKLSSAVHKHPVLIVRGETGCGKSTQMCQIIFEDWIKELRGSQCNILICQPRRIAALSLAERVSYERREMLGKTVGYKMRLNELMLRRRGGMMFYTSGMLREMMKHNTSLQGITHIIIDEVHERSIDVDILLALLKRLLQSNHTLRVILMSATAQVNQLAEYFECHSDAVIEVEGRSFQVDQLFLEDVLQQWQMYLPSRAMLPLMSPNKIPFVNHDLVFNTILKIHETCGPGAVLAFLPGWSDIKRVKNLLNSSTFSESLWVLPLHSRLQKEQQQQVFEQHKIKRKVILATNIAETSLTIQDVVYVVDVGMEKDQRYVPQRHSSTFGTYWVSESSALQRRGRAGRISSGQCYHLFSKNVFDSLQEFPTPEVKKSDLQSVILQCKHLTSEPYINTFMEELVDPPAKKILEEGIDKLCKLKMIDRNMEREDMTPLGKIAVGISTSPYQAKALLFAVLFRCLSPVLDRICLTNMGGQKMFASEAEESDTERNCKLLLHSTSDTIATHLWLQNAMQNTYDELLMEKSQIEFFQDLKGLFTSQLIKGLLSFINCFCYETEDFNVNTNKYCEELIFAVHLLAQGAVVRAVQNQDTNTPLIFTLQGNKVKIHNSSVLKDLNEIADSDLLLVEDLYYSNEQHTYIAMNMSLLQPLTVALFYGTHLAIKENKNHCKDGDCIITVDDNEAISFIVSHRTALLLCEVRSILSSMEDVIFSICDPMQSDNIENEKQLCCFYMEFCAVLADILNVCHNR